MGVIHNIEFAIVFSRGAKLVACSFLSGDWTKTENNDSVVASPTFYLAKAAIVPEAAMAVAAAIVPLAFMTRSSLGTSWVLGLCYPNQSRSRDLVIVTICQGNCIQITESLILFLTYTHAHSADN